MTNLEKIQSMTSEELAMFIREYVQDCTNCPCDVDDYVECFNPDTSCTETIKLWLESKCKKKS